MSESFLSRAARTGGAAALLAFAWAAVPEAGHEAHSRLRHAIQRARDDRFWAEVNVLGEEPARALQRIRTSIPEDAAYVLVADEEEPVRYFIRFALAPRKAIYAGRLADGAPGLRGLEGERPRFAVIARLAQPPELLETAELERRLASHPR